MGTGEGSRQAEKPVKTMRLGCPGRSLGSLGTQCLEAFGVVNEQLTT